MSSVEIIFTLMMVSCLALFVAIPIARTTRPQNIMKTAVILTTTITIIITMIIWIIETYNLIILLP